MSSRKAETRRRDEVLEKLLTKHPDASIKELAELSGIPKASVGRWRQRRASKKPAMVEAPEDERDILNRKIEGLENENKELTDRLREDNQIGQLWRRLNHQSAKAPKWLVPKRKSRNQAIVSAVLADAHYDEKVNPSEIENLNAYNRKIAELRTEKFFSSTVELARDYVANVGINGLVLKLMGDMVSGNIHEELTETNEAYILPSILYWRDRLVAGIDMLAGHYGRVHVAGVVGNHGRQTRKPKSKGRVETNFDWLIYALLADHYADCPEVTVQVPAGADLDLAIYGTRYRLTHGDQFRGGSGIAGALSPMMIGDSRKRKRANQANNPYDFLVMGHWHQYFDFKGIIAAPSLKGYDEYAYLSNFEFEQPGGCFWLTDSNKGRTIRAALHVRHPDEDWTDITTTEPSWMDKAA